MTVDGNPTSAVIIAIAVGGEPCQRASLPMMTAPSSDACPRFDVGDGTAPDRRRCGAASSGELMGGNESETTWPAIGNRFLS
jgi:hypothetical protein